PWLRENMVSMKSGRTDFFGASWLGSRHQSTTIAVEQNLVLPAAPAKTFSRSQGPSPKQVTPREHVFGFCVRRCAPLRNDRRTFSAACQAPFCTCCFDDCF